MTVHPLISQLRGDLAAAADAGRAPKMQAYMKSEMAFRGVSSVPRKKIQQQAIAAHPLSNPQEFESVIRTLWDKAEYREERYAALGVGQARKYRNWALDPARLSLYEHLIRTGAWWDYVDEVAGHFLSPLLDPHPEEAALMRVWAKSDHLWLRRAAILSQLHRRDRTDLDLLTDTIVPNLADQDFFIRKAIGWALRQVFKINSDWVRDFVSTHELSPLSRREALKADRRHR